MNTPLRAGLPPLPERMIALPIDPRGYPIPWFVETLPDGSRDFRIASSSKRVRAVRDRLCWLCGQKLGRYQAFVIGPMCAVNRNTSEPPCHLECAEFAVQACPFLMLPKAQYREANLPGPVRLHTGSLPGNPGAACIWITSDYKPYRVPGGAQQDWLIRIGDPVKVLWYAEGKPATREQIMESFDARLPLLRQVAAEEGPDAEAALAAQVELTMALLPS